MKRSLIWTSLLLFFGLILQAQVASPALKLKNFEKEKITPGLYWYYYLGDQIFDSPQSINILEVNPKKRKVDLLYQATSLQKTSAFAHSVDALAAVNAGFFNMQQGGSVTFLKKDQSVINETQPDVIEKKSVVTEGAFIVLENQRIQIGSPVATEVYSQNPQYDDVLLSGPLLLADGKKLALRDNDFALKRHPRTAACLTRNKRLFLLTADGRNAQASGLSLPELQSLMQTLGCKEAVNLDGGGSTSMYIKTQKGIVNYPSDNRKFDHAGERKVANAIVIH